MSKLYCSCENYSGYLSVSPQELFFASSLFRVDLPYHNIKRISIDTKQIRGSPTSVLVVHLQKHQSVSVLTADGSAERKRRASKKYFFYGFHDLLGAEELVKSNWEAAKKSRPSTQDGDSKDGNEAKADTLVDLPFEKLSAQNSAGRAPPPPATAPPAVRRDDADSRFSKRKAPSVPSRSGTSARGSSGSRGVRRALGSVSTSAIKWLTDLFLSCGPCTLLFVVGVLAVVLLTGLHARNVAVQRRSPHRALDALTEKLALVRERAVQRDSRVSEEASRRAQQQWDRLFEHSDEWVADLGRAANELTHQYVYAQVEMAALRQRRLERLGLEGYFSTNEGRKGHKLRNSFPEFQLQQPFRSQHGHGAAPPETLKHSNSRARGRSFSMQRAREDLARWWSWLTRLQRLVGAVLPRSADMLSSSKRGHTPSHKRRVGAPSTRYAELFIPGFDIAQWVSRDEAEERETCTALSERMYNLATQIEKLFHDYWSVLLASSAEDLASGAVRPRHFSRVPPAVTLGHNKGRDLAYHAGFSGAQLLKLAFIRRYTDAMLFLDPSDDDENRRRVRGREASLSFHSRIGLYALDDPLSANATSIGSRLIEYITNHAVAPGSKPLLVDTLRNMLEEVVLWNRYREEWTAHRLRTLSHNEQRQVIQLIYRALEKSGKGRLLAELNITDIASDYLEHMQTVRPHRLDNVPVFRGMLCFSKHPVLHGGADRDDTGNSPDSSHRPSTSSSPWESHDAQEATVRSLLQSAKERWMHELGVYDIAVGDSPTSRPGHTRSFHLDDDLHSTNPGLSDTRSRLFSILGRFNRQYAPHRGGTFAPFRWFRRAVLWWLPAAKPDGSDAEVLRRMGTLDPVAQLVTAQMVNVSWGNQEDAPLLLMETAFIQPPQLLQQRRDCKRKIMQAWLLFCTFAVLLACLYFFL